MTTKIRRAHPSEADALTRIALAAKAHWGYSAAFMASCRAELTLTPSDVERADIMVLETDGALVGFYSIGGVKPSGSLDHMWLVPDIIGQGFGRLLWHDAMRKARVDGFAQIDIDADPQAEGFYAKMGATKVGEVKSGSVEGRVLPLMRVVL